MKFVKKNYTPAGRDGRDKFQVWVGVILVRVMMKLMMVMGMAKILGMISMVIRIILIMMIPAVLKIH